MRDQERRARLAEAMRETGLDGLIATLPANVLLLTGYFPVVGTSLALVTREGEAACLAPEDERDLAEQGGADRVAVFTPASLDKLESAAEAVREPLHRLLCEYRLERAAIGYECGESFEAASYAAMHLYGSALPCLLESAAVRPADGLFRRLKAKLTAMEIERVRRACRIAALAFEQGRAHLVAGARETEAAAWFRAPIVATGVGFEGVVDRAEGYVSCMAGPHSSRAFGAFARSRAAIIRSGDLVLTHCNSHADGYWTDITRTYSIGRPDDLQRRMYEAVFEARGAALDAIRPGVKAREVDRAARDVMRARGFGEAFKHATGHGVGFAAIDHQALPRIHPQSEDRLEPGMVFNIEPAAYVTEGGLRHCDMALVTGAGAEILTPFQCAPEELIV